jgi:hypothetical protein
VQGRWLPIGKKPFPNNPQIVCQAYEWACPEKFGKFRATFLCPSEEVPRRFYCEAALKAWMHLEDESQFLERTCACGYKILSQLESHPKETAFAYRLYQAVFHNRRLGHLAVTRKFKNLWDFFEFDPRRRRVTLLTPGHSTEHSQMHEGEDVKAAAVRLIRSTFPVGTKLSPSGIIEMLQRSAIPPAVTMQEGEGPLTVAFDRLPARSGIDLVLVDGLQRERPVKLSSIFGCVCSALIDGPCYIDDERKLEGKSAGDETRDENYAMQVREFREAYLHFLMRILSALHRKPLSDFDRWLRVESEHGFRRLLYRDYALKAVPERYPEFTPKTMFRMLLWHSYQMMARCYGALMLVAWLDFCNDRQLQPSLVEQILFRQLHAPQLYLAGLPLDFLGGPQIRWIVRPLLDLWNQEIFEPEAYDRLTDLLGIYGFLAAVRREADRRLQAERKTKAEKQLGEADEPPSPNRIRRAEPGEIRLLTGNKCPTCGNGLSPIQVIDDSPQEWFAAEFYCRVCCAKELYRISRSATS